MAKLVSSSKIIKTENEADEALIPRAKRREKMVEVQGVRISPLIIINFILIPHIGETKVRKPVKPTKPPVVESHLSFGEMESLMEQVFVIVNIMVIVAFIIIT